MTSQRPSLIRLSSILIRPPTLPPPTVSSLPFKLRSPVSMGSPPLSPYATLPHTPTTPPNYTSPVETFAALTNTPASFYSVPTSPTTDIEASLPNSPIRKHVSIASPSETIYGKATSSRLMELLARPPSPLTLPAAQINTDDDRHELVEQETALAQETVDKPMKMLITENGIASNGKNESKKHNKHTKKRNCESEEWGRRVIPFGGKNEGAVMELSLSPKKNHSVGNLLSLNINKTTHTRNFRGDKFSNKDDSEDDESKIKDKTKRITTFQSTPMSIHLNSNVQGVNNSMLFNSFFRHSDPGVQLSLRRKANDDH